MNKATKHVVFIILILALLINNFTFSSAARVSNYKDIQDSWAREYIEDLISLQKIDGYNGKEILPNNLITRAEFSKILLEVIKINKDVSKNTIYFSDVKPSDWYYESVTKMKELGIINGYDDGLFKPSRNISRAEMLAMIVRVSKDNLKVTGTSKIFKDVKYNHWSFRDVSVASKAGLIANFDNNLKPDEPVSRAEVFYSIDKMLWNQKYELVNSNELINLVIGYNSTLDLKYNTVDANIEELIEISFGDQLEQLQDLITRNALYNRLGAKVERKNKITNPQIKAISSGLVKISFEYNLSEKVIFKTGTKLNNETGTINYYLNNINDKWHIYRIQPIKKIEQIKEDKINLVWDYMSYTSTSFKGGVISGLDILSPTWFVLSDAAGNVKSIANKEYVKLAHVNGYKVWALVTNDFDKDMSSLFLKDPVARKNMVNQLVKYITEYNIDGLNVDFENMKTQDRDLFTEFVKELSIELKPKGIVLSVDVTVITPKSNWSECYDRAALAKYSDYIAVMAYDQHWATSPISGSVAQIAWVETELKEILEQVPNTKLLLGLPFYTRVWKEESGSVTSKAISMSEAERLIKENNAKKVWDAQSGQYYSEYKIGNAVYKIWLEDATSIDLKSKLVKKYNLAGVGSWRYGFETPDIWNIIKNNLE